jgi:hypothetical protein
MSKMKNITKIKKYKEKINDLYSKIDEIQEKCIHEHKNVIDKSDTGNYDPSEDIYWSEFKCLDCGKSWWTEREKCH